MIRELTQDALMVDVELSGTQAFDSSGLGALMSLKDQVTKRGGQLRLMNPSRTVTQLLELTSMHRLFVIATGGAVCQPFEKRPILIVEDDDVIRSVAEMSRRALGRRVLSVTNGQEAIHVARREKPAVILLDYIMPIMDGIETLRRLKADEETKGIPVLIMSANDRIASGVHSQFEGASCFVVKPFSPTALRGEVHRLIEGSLEAAA
jgi:CheY-like chemotaxis protein